MNREEVKQLATRAGQLNTDVEKLFSKDGASVILDEWAIALDEVPFGVGLEAIREILKGGVTLYGDGNRLIGLINEYAIQQANEQLNAQRREHQSEVDRLDGYKCLHCKDTSSGQVAIWNPRFVAHRGAEIRELAKVDENLHLVHRMYASWRRKQKRSGGISIAAACCCESPGALKRRERSQVTTQIEFDPTRHYVYGHGNANELTVELEEATFQEWQP